MPTQETRPEGRAPAYRPFSYRKFPTFSVERRVALTLNCQRADGPASFVFTVVQPPCAWFDDSRSLKLLKNTRQRDNTRRSRAVPFVQALSIIFHAEHCSKRNPSLPAIAKVGKARAAPKSGPAPFRRSYTGECTSFALLPERQLLPVCRDVHSPRCELRRTKDQLFAPRLPLRLRTYDL